MFGVLFCGILFLKNKEKQQNIHIYKGLRYSTLQKYFHFCLFMFTLFSLFLLLHFYYVSYFLSCFFILWKL